MKGFDSSYQFGLTVAFAVHLALAALLMLDHSVPHQGGIQTNKPAHIVEAVTIDSKEVDAAVEAIQKHQHAHKQRALDEIKQAALQKQHEAQHLEDIRKQIQAEREKQQAIKNENNQAANKLKELKAQQADMALKRLQAKQQLEATKKASEAAALSQKRIAALAKAKAEEQKHALQQQEQENAEMEKANQQRAAQMVGVVNKYAALIKQAIAQRWILPVDVDRQASCKVQIRLAATGQVLSVTLVRSSGNPLLDRSVNAAVYKASPLPVPTDSAAFAKLRVINLTLRPEQVLSG